MDLSPLVAFAAALAAPTLHEPALGNGALERGRLTELEAQAGWRLLFDGASTAGWVGHGTDAFPQGWDVADGCLHKLPGVPGGDLVTREAFGDFELELEWKVAPGANSGLKYRVAPASEPRAMLGPEYQVLDDAAHAEEAPEHRSGALYALYAPEGKRPATDEEFHRARIVARGARIEHWLDGVQAVACEVGSDDWTRRVAASKFAAVADFATPQAGHVGLQDHGGEVWFRDIRIRTWPPPGEALELRVERGFPGWRLIGDAEFVANEDGILGQSGGGDSSFLVTERSFGDFVLELDVRAESSGNSGIQVRSHQRPEGAVYGYQIEIDPSARAWSGGLYDEGRRGWLADLDGDAAARAAFRADVWNRYRIECIGPSIRAWVDGVPTVDVFDFADAHGFIGLQVHGGQDVRVRWRDLRLFVLGRREWEPVTETAGAEPWHTSGGDPALTAEGWSLRPGGENDPSLLVLPVSPRDFALRVHYRAEGARVRIGFRSAERALPNLAALGRLAPGLFVSELGCVFDPADEGVLAGARAEHLHADLRGWLAVSAYGRRVALHSDGALVADVRDAPSSRAGFLVIEARGPEGSRVALEAIEMLGPPR